MAIECWGASIDFIVRSDRHKQDNLFVFVLDETKYGSSDVLGGLPLGAKPQSAGFFILKGCQRLAGG